MFLLYFDNVNRFPRQDKEHSERIFEFLWKYFCNNPYTCRVEVEYHDHEWIEEYLHTLSKRYFVVQNIVQFDIRLVFELNIKRLFSPIPNKNFATNEFKMYRPSINASWIQHRPIEE